ncbi:MAG: hypothetical protein ACLPSF_00140 [Methylocella sp.]
MNHILVSLTGFALAALLIVYIAYTVWGDKPVVVRAVGRPLILVAIAFVLAVFEHILFFEILFARSRRYDKAGFVLATPMIFYVAYDIWRNNLPSRPEIRLLLKWISFFVIAPVFINLLLFATEIAYIGADACDDLVTSTATLNGRGDIAAGRLHVCTRAVQRSLLSPWRNSFQ